MLSPKYVLITGANRGLGLELVKRFLTLETPPTYVFAACRNPAVAKELSSLAKQNPSLLVLPLDVTDETSIEKARSFVASNVGDDGLTLLINNSGINHHNTSDVTKDAMMEVYEVNTVGPLMISKAFHTLLKKAADKQMNTEISCNRAAIINMSSLAGSISANINMMNYPYRASKAALNMVTKCSSSELKSDGVLCVAIHPGWIKTDMGTDRAPLTVEQGGQAVLNALEQLKGEEMMGVLYSAVKLEIMDW